MFWIVTQPPRRRVRVSSRGASILRRIVVGRAWFIMISPIMFIIARVPGSSHSAMRDSRAYSLLLVTDGIRRGLIAERRRQKNASDRVCSFLTRTIGGASSEGFTASLRISAYLGHVSGVGCAVSRDRVIRSSPVSTTASSLRAHPSQQSSRSH